VTIDRLEDYYWEVTQALVNMPLAPLGEVVVVLAEARDNGKRVYTFGNGGSAATASHFASDLNKGATRKDKPRFRAACLCDNTPVLTAWANDTLYEAVFIEQLKNMLDEGDVVVGISGSGNSDNVLDAVKYASTKGAKSIGLTGFDGGELKDLADIAVVVDSQCMEVIEDVHLVICHSVAVCLREGG